MKLYSIRDRMLNYYQKPFIADDDKQVLAALAQTINSGEPTNAIAQAPHHFELWSIATIDQNESQEKEWFIVQEATLVATLDSLIRGSVRTDGPDRGAEMAKTIATGQGNTGNAPGSAHGKHPITRRPAQG